MIAPKTCSGRDVGLACCRHLGKRPRSTKGRWTRRIAWHAMGWLTERATMTYSAREEPALRRRLYAEVGSVVRAEMGIILSFFLSWLIGYVLSLIVDWIRGSAQARAMLMAASATSQQEEWIENDDG